MPVDQLRLTSGKLPRSATRSVEANAARSSFIAHPRYEWFLRRCGIDSAEAALVLRGEVVCGHPDRHVCRVELTGPAGRRVVYLKREHVVGRKVKLRNWRAGFGWVSRCEREAATLKRLEAAGLSGPQWLAYGIDATGRAFLLVDEVPGAADLRTVLGDSELSPADRRALAERIGRTLAEFHLAGFTTPELAAKHLLVHPRTLASTLIDWQSAAPPGPVSTEDRTRQLAGLHATLADTLGTSAERLRVLWAYRRVCRRTTATTDSIPRFSALVRTIRATAMRARLRSSVRDQRQQAGGAQRLVWLAGEAVCAVPELVEHWPIPVDGPPFYPPPSDVAGGPEWLTFRNGRRGLLVRFRTVDPVGRLASAVRERPWRSPAAVAARVLFHLDRYGIAGPRLLAFGQRTTGRCTAESFVLFEPPTDRVPVPIRLTEYKHDDIDRLVILTGCGRLLRSLHDAGCRPDFRPIAGPRMVCPRTGGSRVAVGSPFTVRLTKRLSDSDHRADLRAMLRLDLPGLTLADRCRVVRGYLGDTARSVRANFIRKVV